MKLSNLTYLLLILPLFYQCANPTQPTGGPKDKEPPKIINTIPSIGALNFKDKIIELEFNEMIKEDNLNQKLIITPRVKGKFKSKVQRNKITLTFEEPFTDSTTYTLNFRDGIKDVTESNPAKDLILVFSTGTYLDSMSLEGNVTTMLTNDPVADQLVALYPVNDTLNFLNAPPLYATQTDKTGKYKFQNLKASKYYIYTFKDKNSNLTCQTASEAYGFLLDPINLDSSLINVNLKSQNLDLRPLIMTSSRPNGRYYEIRFNKPINDLQLSPLIEMDSLYRNLIDDRRTVRFYNTFENDSIPLQIFASDSSGFTLSDTLFIRFEKTTRPPESFSAITQHAQVKILNKEFTAAFTFTKPLNNFSLDSLYIVADSIEFSIQDFQPSLKWDTQNLTLTLTATFTDSLLAFSNSSLRLGKSLFISVENDTSKASTFSIKKMNPDNFGIIHLQIDSITDNYIVNLIGNKNKIVSTINNKTPITFDYLDAGIYKIRLFIDINQNGRWDPGNFLLRKINEPVYLFYDEEAQTNLITVKKNWILGPYIMTRSKPE